MSDVEITGTDVIDFLVEKNAIPTCVSCGENDWEIIVSVGERQEMLPAFLLHTIDSFALPPPALPIAIMGCRNCAFMRAHSLTIIQDWKRSRGNDD